MIKLFPDNPTDGQIVELSNGQTYQYASFARSWQLIVKPQIPLATPISDGLMSKEDYYKLTNIILPPPQITITPTGCSTISSGYVTFLGDNYITISIDSNNVHENTGLINIGLDVDSLITELRNLNRIRFITPAGDQGDQGESGDDGLDSLPVGPYGETGPDGLDAEWPGSLVQDNLSIKEDNKAIVDIDVERVSADENYITVKRATIGNPDACPDTILPQNIQSPWLLVFSPGAVGTKKTQTDDGNLVCSWSCNSTIHYLNIQSIVDSVRNQTAIYLESERARKLKIVKEKLDELATIFEQQKIAIGCALEKVRSRSRNIQARQYLEQYKLGVAGINATYQK